MIEYDADLVSDSSLTHTVVRKRLERWEGRGEGVRVREGGEEMKEDRWRDLDTVVHTQSLCFKLSFLENE